MKRESSICKFKDGNWLQHCWLLALINLMQSRLSKIVSFMVTRSFKACNWMEGTSSERIQTKIKVYATFTALVKNTNYRPGFGIILRDGKLHFKRWILYNSVGKILTLHYHWFMLGSDASDLKSKEQWFRSSFSHQEHHFLHKKSQINWNR